jgi:hypothetical protein
VEHTRFRWAGSYTFGIDWELLALVGINAITIPLLYVWWRKVAWDDPYFVKGIPTRSAFPLLLSLPLSLDALWAGARMVSRHVGMIAFWAVMAAALGLTLSTWVARRPTWAIPPKLRHPTREDHDLAVYYVDASDGAKEPYCVALCSCGWTGDIFDHREPADREAVGHYPAESLELRRPGGKLVESSADGGVL